MDDREDKALTFAQEIAFMSDEELRANYFVSGDAGEPWSDALAEACRERSIDID